jgi:tetratricopeptide (TPR) repeat protein
MGPPSTPERRQRPSSDRRIAKRVSPASWPIAFRATAYANKGDLDKVIADCTEAIRLDPKFAAAYCNRAVAYGNKGDLSGALTDFSDAIRLQPDYGQAYYNRGTACQSMGESDNAEVDFAEAKKIGLARK